jgi:hypothetical protein
MSSNEESVLSSKYPLLKKRQPIIIVNDISDMYITKYNDIETYIHDEECIYNAFDNFRQHVRLDGTKEEKELSRILGVYQKKFVILPQEIPNYNDIVNIDINNLHNVPIKILVSAFCLCPKKYEYVYFSLFNELHKNRQITQYHLDSIYTSYYGYTVGYSDSDNDSA